MMNDLYSFHAQHRNSRVMHKWEHYFEIYERFLSPIRSANPMVLEIGVQLGGSVEMWRYYFGPATRIYGIDINPDAKQQEDIITKVFIGDQQDRSFLRSVLQRDWHTQRGDRRWRTFGESADHGVRGAVSCAQRRRPVLCGRYPHVAVGRRPSWTDRTEQSFLQFSSPAAPS